jgi:hypothetical protein
MYRGHHPRPTLIRTFNVASANPVSSHTLPFKLRRVVWNPYTASGTDFTLVGITQSWNSVVLGDRVHLPVDEGSSARGISADMSPHRRNIFQDIFGVSAFQDFPIQAPAPASAAPEDAIGLPKFNTPLNAPAYLLPPLHTLFTPLVEGLLRKRSTHSPLEMNEQEQIEDEDVVMADPPLARSRSGRTLQEGEMDEFVELFKQQTFCTFAAALQTSNRVLTDIHSSSDARESSDSESGGPFQWERYHKGRQWNISSQGRGRCIAHPNIDQWKKPPSKACSGATDPYAGLEPCCRGEKEKKVYGLSLPIIRRTCALSSSLFIDMLSILKHYNTHRIVSFYLCPTITL